MAFEKGLAAPKLLASPGTVYFGSPQLASMSRNWLRCTQSSGCAVCIIRIICMLVFVHSRNEVSGVFRSFHPIISLTFVQRLTSVSYDTGVQNYSFVLDGRSHGFCVEQGNRAVSTVYDDVVAACEVNKCQISYNGNQFWSAV